MRSKLATLAVAAAALVGIAGASARAAETDIVETAIATGQFKTLATALDRAGLVATLKGRDRSPFSPRRTRPSPSCPPVRSTTC